MGDEDIQGHLCRLGLTRLQAELYVSLLAEGPCATQDLALRMGRHPRSHEMGHLLFGGQALDRELAHLRKLGLITTAGTDTGEHVPVEPSIALEAMALTRSAEVHQAHLAAIQAYRGYRRSTAPQETEDLLEVVRGPHVAERIWNIEEAVESQVLRFDPPPYHTHGTANPIEIEKLGNGVEYRVVYSNPPSRTRPTTASTSNPASRQANRPGSCRPSPSN